MSMEKTGISRRSFMGILAAGAATVGARGALALELTPEVLRVKDPENMTSLEAKHVPRISVPPTVRKGDSAPVSITVQHVMTTAHHVERIEVYWEGMLLTTVPLTPELMDCKVTVHLLVPGPGKLVARELCNLHGLWEAEQQVQVS
jgi:superoxide reductase